MSAHATSPVSRQHYLDHLKVLLTALVVLHHAAITYGAAGDWFYRDPAPGYALPALVLTLFCAVNQSFFMGMFFLLAGYLTPDSLERKGPARFLRERLVRLGIPLLCFGLLLGPMTVQLGQGASWTPLSWSASTEQGVRFVMGPLWFCWALLILSFVYVALARTRQHFFWQRVPSPAVLTAGAVVVGLLAFGVRLLMPVGTHLLGIQLGYFVSYAVLFLVGCLAARHRLLDQLTGAQVWPLVWVGLVALPILPVWWLVAMQAGYPLESFLGGWHVAALVYAMWEPLVAWGLIGGLLLWGKQHLNRPFQGGSTWTSSSYGAFVFHAPVLVALSVAAAPLAAPAWLKFLVVAALATLLSFLAAALLRLIPGVKAIL